MQLDPVLSDLMLQYNVWYGEQYHHALEQIESESDAWPIQIDSQPWFDQELVVYDDQDQTILFKGRPLEWLSDHPQPDQMVELAWHAAALCDDDLPQPIIKLLSGSAIVCNAVVEFILGEDFNRLQADYEDPRSLAVSRLLLAVGPCCDGSQLNRILDRFMTTTHPDDMVTDAIKQVFAQHAPQSVHWLTERLQTALDRGFAVTGPVEALMIFLSEAGCSSHAPESFTAMRTAFRRAEDKQVAALCLGDFGDPRGISVLRSWLDSHPETSRHVRLEIVAAIKRLGGETD